jgi:serine/threonine protein kinase
MLQVKWVACKRFHASNRSLMRDSKRELENLEVLKESITTHDHIRIHLAVLFHKDEHLILLPWADNLDLDLFLAGGRDFSGNVVYDFETRFPNARKGVLIKEVCLQMYWIAHALEWLHKGVQGGRHQSRVHFAHMDLKPNNILIDRDQRSSVGKWLLTDFGISAFKEDNESSASDLLSIRDLFELTIQTNPRRDPGAYQPPEVQRATSNPLGSRTEGANEGSAGRKGDIWSFACIFSEVLAFSLGQATAVQEFRATRTKGRDDYFYEVVTPQFLQPNRYNETYRVRAEVVSWLHKLHDRYESPNRGIECCVATILQTLVVDGLQRPKAHELLIKMDHVLHHVNADRAPVTFINCPLNKQSTVDGWSAASGLMLVVPERRPVPPPVAQTQTSTTPVAQRSQIGTIPFTTSSPTLPRAAPSPVPLLDSGHQSPSTQPTSDSFSARSPGINLELSQSGDPYSMPPTIPVHSDERLFTLGRPGDLRDSRSSFSRDFRSDLRGVTVDPDMFRTVGRVREYPMAVPRKAKVHAITLCPSGLRVAQLRSSSGSQSREVFIHDIDFSERNCKQWRNIGLSLHPTWEHVVLAGDRLVVWGNTRDGRKIVSS